MHLAEDHGALGSELNPRVQCAMSLTIEGGYEELAEAATLVDAR